MQVKVYLLWLNLICQMVKFMKGDGEDVSERSS